MATILIIDDSLACRKAAAALLHAEGHKVLGADNAWRGLTIIESMPVDLVILDLLLPGLNGFGFLKDIQSSGRFAGMPVIVATAMDESPELWAQGRPQVKKWLNKGKYSGDDLLDAVSEVLPVRVEHVTTAA